MAVLESGAVTADALSVERLTRLDERLLWLACWTIHNANVLRENTDGLKVGGHQASCASMSTLMAVLYFSVLRPADRVAVKPHASPLYHAVQHLFGRQTVDNLGAFRGLGGAQSYPSRTKDVDDVDFSTGSVGLGVGVTVFASLVQDFLEARGQGSPLGAGRMIALLGDAELDEGNIYEALLEAAKHDVRNVWWIVDHNRQGLDAVSSDRMTERFEDIFAACDWRVETIKYGVRLRAAFEQPGGEALQGWINACANDEYAALVYEGGAAWRARLEADIGSEPGVDALLSGLDDDELAALMTDLGGHCVETLLEVFNGVDDDRPRLFIPYTIKGFRLPFQGHKDNHSGIMTAKQMDAFRERMGVAAGEEWDPLSGLSDEERAALEAFVASSPFAADVTRRFTPAPVPMPPVEAFATPDGDTQSTQAAFGAVLNDLARRDDEFADRIVTMAPDVTVTTNLSAFVNRRGLFARAEQADVFRDRKLPSAQVWRKSPTGQHLELGIAENNLFLALAAYGLAGSVFGTQLAPVGTLYDPFIARGLDALNYACYQDARFILAGTPSGLTLAPEGGAHQSISTPLIGMGQPGLDSYEPAFADEVAAILRQAFARVFAADGASSYLRLTTRAIPQPDRVDDAWIEPALKGAYWLVPPAPGARLAIAYCGAVAPEAREAFDAVREDEPGAGLLAVTAPDLLHRDWSAANAAPWTGAARQAAHVHTLLGTLSADARLVTVLDGSPAALSWLGGVHGHRVQALGVDRFGQSGALADLHREYRLDADAILDACASALLA